MKQTLPPKGPRGGGKSTGVGPLQRLAAAPAEYDEQERAEIIARYCDEYPRLYAAFDAFCRGHAGPHYMIEEKRFWGAVFLDISRLFAQERDSLHYRLILHPAGALHDRWMRFDQKRLVSLGGSSKDAGDRQYFTVTSIEPTTDNLLVFQKHLDAGTEYYGPSTPTHQSSAWRPER